MPRPYPTSVGAGTVSAKVGAAPFLVDDDDHPLEQAAPAAKGGCDGRVPMVAFAGLDDEQRSRLRAANIADSVVLTRTKSRANSTEVPLSSCVPALMGELHEAADVEDSASPRSRRVTFEQPRAAPALT
jgi:hypothetical protein